MFLSRRFDSVFECTDTDSESFPEAAVSRLLAGITQDIVEATVPRSWLEGFSFVPTLSEFSEPGIGFPNTGLKES